MKILNLEQLKILVDDYRSQGKKIVWTNGCFDLLHPGHIYSLKKAKEKGDILIVGIDSDISVRKLKGHSRPIINEEQRAKSLEALEYVDHIIVFNFGEAKNIIAELEPDFYVKSGDYSIETINQKERKIIESYRGEIYLPEGLKGFSTKGIIEKIKNNSEIKKKLSNKVALITGGLGGIGREIALEFAKEGASIVIAYKYDPELTSSFQKEISKYCTNLKFLKYDLNSYEDIENIVKRTIEIFGRIDILINNAAIYERINFLDIKEENWNKTLDVNLKAPFFLSQKTSEHMLKQGGSIINISSNAGIKPKKNRGIDYGISKSGINYLTKSLAISLAPKIRVNAIAPGYTETEMSEFYTNPKLKKEIESTIPLERVNSPKDIAKLALFLVSEDSRNITGEVIIIDGGKNLQ